MRIPFEVVGDGWVVLLGGDSRRRWIILMLKSWLRLSTHKQSGNQVI